MILEDTLASKKMLPVDQILLTNCKKFGEKPGTLFYNSEDRGWGKGQIIVSKVQARGRGYARKS
jgi:hypothetical protein